MAAPPEARRVWQAAAIAGAVAGAIVASGAHYALKRFEPAGAPPPIAVVDFGQVVADLPKDDSAPQTVNHRMARVREAVKKLTDAGYLVLDGQAVLGAPEGAYVPAELVR